MRGIEGTMTVPHLLPATTVSMFEIHGIGSPTLAHQC